MLPRSKSFPLKDTTSEQEEASTESSQSAPTSPREIVSRFKHRFFHKSSSKKIILPLETNTLHVGIYGKAKVGKTTLIHRLASLPMTEINQSQDTPEDSLQSDRAFVYAKSLTATYQSNHQEINLVFHEIYDLSDFEEERKKAKISLDLMILVQGLDGPDADNDSPHDIPQKTSFQKELITSIDYISETMKCPIALAVNFSDTSLACMTRDDIDALVADRIVIHADFISAKTGDQVDDFFRRVLNMTVTAEMETSLADTSESTQPASRQRMAK